MSDNVLKMAGKAVAWNAIGNWIGLIGGFLSLIVVARILTPAEFGIFGLVLLTLIIPETIACNSLGESLIQRPDLRRGHLNSVFLQGIIFAALFYTGLFFTAPLISQGFGVPELTPYLRVMALALFVGALITVPAALLQRNLRFKEIAAVDLLGVLVATIVTISLALTLKSPWALIGGELARRTTRMIAFSAFARWVPGVQTSWQETKDLIRFNSSAIGIRLTAVAETDIPRFFIGVILGPAALGMFNLASRIQDQAMLVLVAPFATVSLPVVAKVRNDIPTLHKVISGAIQIASMVTFPALIGAIAIAPVAVPFVFGEQWIPAVLVIQIALLTAIRRPVEVFSAGVLKGLGKPGLLLRAMLISMFATVFFIPFAAMHSLEMVMLVLLAQKLLAWLLVAGMVSREIQFSIRTQITAGASALVASLLMGASVWGLLQLLPTSLHDAITLSLAIAVGAVVFALAMLAITPKFTLGMVRNAGRLVLGKLRRQEPPQTAA